MHVTRLINGFTVLLLFFAHNLAMAATPGWLAYGDLRGHIEPCGCDPATDLGGIKRLGSVIARERALRPDIGVFALGNDFPQPGQHEVKIPFLLEADSLLAPTAMLVNELELLQLDRLKALLKAEPNLGKTLHLVLSNALPRSSAANVAAYLMDDGQYVVLGYAYSANTGALTESVSPVLLKRWKMDLEKHKGRHRVLLFSGSDSDLKTIAKASLFDAIIASNRSPMTTEPGTAERSNENLLKRLNSPTVYSVPLGGQGILRGGSLLFEEAKPLSAYLGDNPKANDVGLFNVAKLVTWVGVDAGESDAFKALYSRYDAAVKADFKDAGTERLKDLASTPFVGVNACASCHAEAVKVYQGTQHSRAMKTLQDKGKHQDAECVACHSVGAKTKGGFVSIEASPQLANVQCENCHGSRKEHVKDPTKKPAEAQISAREVCVSCHNTQHSPQFNPTEYWQRIQHK